MWRSSAARGRSRCGLASTAGIASRSSQEERNQEEWAGELGPVPKARGCSISLLLPLLSLASPVVGAQSIKDELDPILLP